MFLNKKIIDPDLQSNAQSENGLKDELFQFDKQSEQGSSDEEMQSKNFAFCISECSNQTSHQEFPISPIYKHLKNKRTTKQNEHYEPGLRYDQQIFPELKRENNIIKQQIPEIPAQEQFKKIQQSTDKGKVQINQNVYQNELDIIDFNEENQFAQSQFEEQKELPYQTQRNVNEYNQVEIQQSVLASVATEKDQINQAFQNHENQEEPIIELKNRLSPQQNGELNCEPSSGEKNNTPKQEESKHPQYKEIESEYFKKWPFPPTFDINLIPSQTQLRKHFLTSPLPQGVNFQCSIVRAKSGLARLYPIYHMYYSILDKQYLLSAKKLVLNSTSSYIITMSKDNFSTKSNLFLGKVRSNFMGTEFIMWDNGLNPKHTKSTISIRNQLGCIYYESNLMQNKGPRRMKILVPKVNLETNMAKPVMPLNQKEGIQFDYQKGNTEFIDVFQNKFPKWNANIGAYVLNFYGRVDKPSVKNFQLIKSSNQERIYFQFGRITDEEFNLDFTWPFSPLQALQICVSSFDFKFACE